jgi:hypothetical protein
MATEILERAHCEAHTLEDQARRAWERAVDGKAANWLP